VLSDRVMVVLVSTRNPLNIGAAARAMSNFGFPRLRVVKPYDAAWREARSAVGASSLLTSAEECASVAAAVEDCSLVVGTTAAHNRELQHPLRTLNEGARLIRKCSSRVALLFGSEKRGLSNEDLSHCHWLMRIPTREEHGSMNLGQAVAVCLYELTRASRAPRRIEKTKRATTKQSEALTQRLMEALIASEYVKRNAAVSTETKIRRMVRRLELPEADADTWLGILRQVLWKLEQQR